MGLLIFPFAGMPLYGLLVTVTELSSPNLWSEVLYDIIYILYLQHHPIYGYLKYSPTFSRFSAMPLRFDATECTKKSGRSSTRFADPPIRSSTAVGM